MVKTNEASGIGISNKNNRNRVLDCAKGIAIILVVIGHWIPEFSPQWYKDLVCVIYTFHMPLFLALSGYLYIATKKDDSYIGFLHKKFKRLMMPYLTTSVIVITIKLISGYSIGQSDPVNIYSYVEMLWLPAAGYFLWFIWTLWTIFLIVPFFKTRVSRLALFIVGVALHFINDIFDFPEIFCLSQTSEMMVYFMSGVVAYDFKSVIRIFDSVSLIIVAALFVAAEILYLKILPGIYDLLPFLGIWFIIKLSQTVDRRAHVRIKTIINAVSVSSYIIYLFHTTFEGIAKSVCFHCFPLVIHTSTGVFVLCSLIVVSCGVGVPMLLYKYVLRSHSVTCYLFGLKRNDAILKPNGR